MGRAARWMRTLLAYAMPAYLVMLSTLAVQGAVVPWPPARDVLARHAGQWPVTVGITTRSGRSPERGVETEKSRYYVLVPGVLGDPRLLRVTQVGDGPVREASSRSGFWALLAAILACTAGTWWAWLRPPRDRAGTGADAG